MTGRHRAVAVALALSLVAACGDGDDVTSDPTASAPVGSDPAAPDPATDPRLPFDLGPGIVRGGDDVVAEGGVVDADGGFELAVDDLPVVGEATAYRFEPDAARAEQVRAAASALFGDRDGDGDAEVEITGTQFVIEVGGHHDDGAGEPVTTVPAPGSPTGERPDVDDARRRALAFLDAAGLATDPGAVRVFESDDFVSIEVDIALIGPTPTLRATASVTFDAAGDVVGGYGPVGEAIDADIVEVIDAATAARRLTLVQRLSGYPTTTYAPPEARRIVQAELVVSLRDVLDAAGLPTGETWLVPAYRFVDDTGTEHEIIAVVAASLRIDEG